MNRSVKSIAFFLATAGAAALAPESLTLAPPAGASPVAYVYVSTSPSSGAYQINGYSAASSGSLTPISGSPFPSSVYDMAVNGSYLFGTDGTYIDSFSIASSGALKQVSSLNATVLNPYDSGGPATLFLDHSGAFLYDGDYSAYCTDSNAYQFFSVESGGLNYMGLSPEVAPKRAVPSA